MPFAPAKRIAAKPMTTRRAAQRNVMKRRLNPVYVDDMSPVNPVDNQFTWLLLIGNPQCQKSLLNHQLVGMSNVKRLIVSQHHPKRTKWLEFQQPFKISQVHRIELGW